MHDAISPHTVIPGAGLARPGRPRGPVLPGRRRTVRRDDVPGAPDAWVPVSRRDPTALGRGAGRAARPAAGRADRAAGGPGRRAGGGSCLAEPPALAGPAPRPRR